MTRAWWAISFLALGLSVAKAQTVIYSVGVGRLSCAYWLSSPEHEAEGRSWALGFWTASNLVNEANHTVGSSTDTEMILGEMKQVCSQEPSRGLVDAVVLVYVRLMQEGK